MNLQVYDVPMGLIQTHRYAFLAVLLGAILLLEQYGLHTLSTLQNRLSDAMVAHHALNGRPDPDIVIIDIDERSLAKMSPSVGRWPWPRSMHAELVEGINRQRPRAIVFDILFSDPDLTRPQDDQFFFETIRASRDTFFPMLVLDAEDASQGIPLAKFGNALGIVRGPEAQADTRVSLVLPLPAMLETGRLGAHNAVNDEDGVLRGYPLYHDRQGWQIPSLPARVASEMGYKLPKDSWITLNWQGRALSYHRVSYSDVYEDLQRRNPTRPKGEFAGKIVIIGSTANGLHDVRATPVDGFFPGVEILATAIDNLKHGNSLRLAPSWVATILGVLLLGGLAGLFQRFRRQLPKIGMGMVVVTIAMLAVGYLALSWRWLLPLLTPLVIAWIYYAISALMEYLSERKARERAVQTFSRFLDPRVVQLLVERGETAQTLSGKSSDITVLFSDIRGFTSLSENSPPEEIVDLLNRYFTTQSEAIFEHEGTLDKYIGDAIMAFWGAPVEQPDHALRAVSAALTMSRRLEEFRKEAGALGAQLEIGIGIHSGPAVVGFLGSRNRQDYTAIGDSVNLASRIEGQTKGIARILVSEDTKRLCELQSGGNCAFEFVEHGSHHVKGREQPVSLFEPRRRS